MNWICLPFINREILKWSSDWIQIAYLKCHLTSIMIWWCLSMQLEIMKSEGENCLHSWFLSSLLIEFCFGSVEHWICLLWFFDDSKTSIYFFFKKTCENGRVMNVNATQSENARSDRKYAHHWFQATNHSHWLRKSLPSMAKYAHYANKTRTFFVCLVIFRYI